MPLVGAMESGYAEQGFVAALWTTYIPSLLCNGNNDKDLYYGNIGLVWLQFVD